MGIHQGRDTETEQKLHPKTIEVSLIPKTVEDNGQGNIFLH